MSRGLLPWEKRNNSSAEAPPGRDADPQQVALNNHNQSIKDLVLRDDIPVETFLQNTGTIPSRLKASELSVFFRSNMPGATFECSQTGYRGFHPCPQGAYFDFGPLADGNAYSLLVRAVASDGRHDRSPLIIAFLVDLQNGAEIQAPGDDQLLTDNAAVPSNPDALPEPWPAQPEETGGEAESERAVQVGGYFALAVPYGYLVTSYATNRTYNGVVRMMRTLQGGVGAAYEDEPCNRPWEREVPGPMVLPYCDGTATEQQLLQEYRNPLPFNHVEMVRLSSPQAQISAGANERLTVALLDSAQDPTRQSLDLDATCMRALARGSALVPVLQDYYGRTPSRGRFYWCQIRDQSGIYWWVGSTDVQIGSQGASMRILYSVQADDQRRTGAAFAQSAAQFLQQILVPLMPAE